MLSTAVRRLINLHAVRPGERAVVLTANADGDAAVEDLRRAGVDVAHVADARRGEDVVRVHGRTGVKAVELADGRRVDADLLVTADRLDGADRAAQPVRRPSGLRAPRRALRAGGRAARRRAGRGRDRGRRQPRRATRRTPAPSAAEAARRASLRRRDTLARLPTRPGGAPLPGRWQQPVAIPALPLDDHPELFRGRTHGIVDFSEDVSSHRHPRRRP